MKKWMVLALCLALAGCAHQAKPEEKTTVSPGFPAETAPLDGDTSDPGGNYEICLRGHSEGITSGGLYPTQRVQIVDINTGEAKWEGLGGYRICARWSPDGRYVALSRMGRAWESITVVETETFREVDVTLPGGGSFPEYAFVEDMAWAKGTRNMEAGSLRFTLNPRSEEEEVREYRFYPDYHSGVLEGQTFAQTAEILGEYDFDHDGVLETARVETVWDPDEADSVFLYELRLSEDGEWLWGDDAHLAHAGYNAIFACGAEGKDYLLRYHPGMGMGYADYSYQFFSLNEVGEEVILKENGVEFDVNFYDPLQGNFDPAAISAFLQDVYGYLEHGTILLSTEGGVLATGGTGADFFRENDFFGLPEDESLWEQVLGDYADTARAEQAKLRG